MNDYPDEVYNAALADYPLGCSLLQLGRYEEAMESFTRCVEQYRGIGFVPLAQFYLGLCHYSLGHWREAIEELHKFIQDYPEQPSAFAAQAHFVSAWCWLKQGEYARAADEFAGIGKIPSMEGLTQFADQAAKVSHELSGLHDRVKSVQAEASVLPILEEALLSLLQPRLELLGEWDHWFTAFDTAADLLTVGHDEGAVVLPLAEYLYSEGQYGVAITSLERSIRSLAPGQRLPLQAYLLLGKSWEALEDYRNAVNVYESILRDNVATDKNLAAAMQYHVVRLYQTIGDVTSAKKAAEKLIEQFPDSQEAPLTKRFLETEEKKGGTQDPGKERK